MLFQISIIPMVKSSSTGKSEPMSESTLPPNHLSSEGSSALAKVVNYFYIFFTFFDKCHKIMHISNIFELETYVFNNFTVI